VDKLDIIVWVLSGGFSLMLIMWYNLSNRIDAVEKSVNSKVDKLSETVTDIDRRLCRLEGAFSSKDCCMIKDDKQAKKAE